MDINFEHLFVKMPILLGKKAKKIFIKKEPFGSVFVVVAVPLAGVATQFEVGLNTLFEFVQEV